MAYADLAADRLERSSRPPPTRTRRSPTSSPATAARSHAFAALGTHARPLGRGRRRDRARTPRSARRSTTSCSASLEIAAKRTGAWDQARARADDRAREAQAAVGGRRAVPSPPRGAAPRSPRRSRAAINSLRRALELGGERQAWLSDLVALERDQGTVAAAARSAAPARRRRRPRSRRARRRRRRRQQARRARAGAADPVGRARPRDRRVARHRVDQERALGRCRREVGDRRRSSISIAPVAAPAPPSTR